MSNEYSKRLYGQMKANYGEGLKISETDFVNKLSTDSAYASGLYSKLKNIYGDKLTLSEEDFISKVGLKKKEGTQEQSSTPSTTPVEESTSENISKVSQEPIKEDLQGDNKKELSLSPLPTWGEAMAKADQPKLDKLTPEAIKNIKEETTTPEQRYEINKAGVDFALEKAQISPVGITDAQWIKESASSLDNYQPNAADTTITDADGSKYHIVVPTSRIIDGQVQELSGNEAVQYAVQNKDMLIFHNSQDAKDAAKAINEGLAYVENGSINYDKLQDDKEQYEEQVRKESIQATVQQNDKTISELESKLDKEREAAVYRLKELKKEYKGIADIGTLHDLLKQTPEYSQVTTTRAAIKFIDGANRILKNMEDGQLSFWEAWNEKPIQDIILGSITELENLVKTKDIAKRYAEGKPVSEDEMKVLTAYSNLQAMQASSQKEGGMGYGVGTMIRDMIPFIVDIAATRGIGTVAKKGTVKIVGNIAKKKISNKFARRYLDDILGNEIKKNVAKKIVATVGGVIGAVQRAAIAPTTIKGTVDRQIGDVVTDEEGKIEIKNQKDDVDAYTTSWVNNIVEFATEGIFDEITPLSKLIKAKNMSKVGSVPLFSLSGEVKNVVIGSAGKKTLYNKIAKQIQYNGLFKENAEEMLAGIVQPYVTGEGSVEDYFTADNLLKVFLSTAAVGGTLKVMSGVAEGVSTVQNLAKINYQRGVYNKLTPEQKQSVNDAFMGKTSQEQLDRLRPLLLNQELNEKQKAAIIEMTALHNSKIGEVLADNDNAYFVGNKYFASEEKFLNEVEKVRNSTQIPAIGWTDTKVAKKVNDILSGIEVEEEVAVEPTVEVEEKPVETKEVKTEPKVEEKPVETKEVPVDEIEELKKKRQAEKESKAKEQPLKDNVGKKLYRGDEVGELKEEGQSLIFETPTRKYELGNKEALSESTLEEHGLSEYSPEGIAFETENTFKTKDGNSYTITRRSKPKKGESVVTAKDNKTGLIKKFKGAEAEFILKESALAKPKEVKSVELKVEGKEVVETKKETKKEAKEISEEEFAKIEKESKEDIAKFESELIETIAEESKMDNRIDVKVGEQSYAVSKKGDTYTVSKQNADGKFVAERNTEAREKAIKSYDEAKEQRDSGRMATAQELLESYKQEKNDKILDWLDRQIQQTKNKGRMYDATLGIPIAAYNAGLQIVRAAYKSGKKLAQAIEDGYNYLISKGHTIDKDAYIDKVLEDINKPVEETKKEGTKNKKEGTKKERPELKLSSTNINDIRAYIRENKTKLTNKQYDVLMTKMKNAAASKGTKTHGKRLQDVVDYINESIESNQQQAIETELQKKRNKILDPKRLTTKSSGRTVAKKGFEGENVREFFNNMVEMFNGETKKALTINGKKIKVDTQKDIDEILENLSYEIQEAIADGNTDKANSLAATMKGIELTRYIDQQTDAYALAVLEEIDAMIKDQKGKVKEIVEKEAYIAETKKHILDHLKGIKIPRRIANATANWANLNYILELLGDKTTSTGRVWSNYLHRNFKNKFIDKAADEYKVLTNGLIKDKEKLAKKVYPKNTMLNMIENNQSHKTGIMLEYANGTTEELVASKNEAIQYYMWSLNEAARETLLEPINVEKSLGNGFTEETLAQLKDYIGEDGVAMAEGLHDIYKKYYDIENEVYRKPTVNGIDIPFEENYYGKRIRLNDNAPAFGQKGYSNSITVGHHKKATRSKKTLVQISAMENFNNYAKDAINYAAFKEAHDLFSKILMNPAVKNFVEKKFGERMVKNIDFHGKLLSGDMYVQSSILDKLAISARKGILYFKRSTGYKQLVSSLLYGIDMPTSKLIAEIPVMMAAATPLGKGTVNGEIIELLKNQPFVYSRNMNTALGLDYVDDNKTVFDMMFEGIAKSPLSSLDIKLLNKALAGVELTQSQIKRVNDIMGGWLMKAGDAFPLVFAGASYLKHKAAQHKGSSLTKQDFKDYKEGKQTKGAMAIEQALMDWRVTSESTQQSSDRSNMAKARTSSSTNRLFNTFSSAQHQQLLLKMMAIGDVRQGIAKGNKTLIKRGIKTIGATTAVFTIISLIGAGFAVGGEDKEIGVKDLLEKSLLYTLEGIPFLGSVASTALYFIKQGRGINTTFIPSLDVSIDVVNDLSRYIKELNKSIPDDEKLETYKDNLAYSFLRFAGFGAENVAKEGQAMRDLINGESENTLLSVLNLTQKEGKPIKDLFHTVKELPLSGETKEEYMERSKYIYRADGVGKTKNEHLAEYKKDLLDRNVEDEYRLERMSEEQIKNAYFNDKYNVGVKIKDPVMWHEYLKQNTNDEKLLKIALNGGRFSDYEQMYELENGKYLSRSKSKDLDDRFFVIRKAVLLDKYTSDQIIKAAKEIDTKDLSLNSLIRQIEDNKEK